MIAVKDIFFFACVVESLDSCFCIYGTTVETFTYKNYVPKTSWNKYC